MPGSDSARRDVVRPDRIRGIVAQWPLILVLVAVWCALWQDFAPHVALAGLAFALLILVLFPMPSIPFSGRLNPWWSLVFTGRFLVDVVRASVHVTGVVLLRGRRARGSIVGVPLRSHDDLIITLVSHALALVPGSIVLDVDRVRSVLYLHVLDATTDEDVEGFRATALDVEAGIIRAVGTREDLELVRRFPSSAPPAARAEDRRGPADPSAARPPKEEA
ncbi:Na+/H+ antiporter subunit E [Micrococcus luteus]|uniref:Na+/H+ antiporter subunit E n=1 Tax=Micrococcus luteus TaxID=1270 RepID=UPI00190FC736|nr:Na+/H+ antiporter subunit E [Micrococcus luteus]QQE48959.1 Na+/H+ antiporter subunit E [Micrococcus luteus]